MTVHVSSRLVKRQARHQNEMQKLFLRRFPQFPDQNPIDNFCSQKFKRMEGKNPKNANELWQNIVICWKAIPQSFCRNLVESLPNRWEILIVSTKKQTNIVIKINIVFRHEFLLIQYSFICKQYFFCSDREYQYFFDRW